MIKEPARSGAGLGFEPRSPNLDPSFLSVLLLVPTAMQVHFQSQPWNSLQKKRATGTGHLPWQLGFGLEVIVNVDTHPASPEIGWVRVEWNGNEGCVCSRLPPPCHTHNG